VCGYPRGSRSHTIALWTRRCVPWKSSGAKLGSLGDSPRLQSSLPFNFQCKPPTMCCDPGRASSINQLPRQYKGWLPERLDQPHFPKYSDLHKTPRTGLELICGASTTHLSTCPCAHTTAQTYKISWATLKNPRVQKTYIFPARHAEPGLAQADPRKRNQGTSNHLHMLLRRATELLASSGTLGFKSPTPTSPGSV
jgi:hypothetical protein